MIKINLLGYREGAKKPVKRKERKGRLPTKTILYVVILLIAVGLGLYEFFPGLLNIISSKPEPAEIEIPEKAAMIEDTTKQVALQQEVPPAIKPEKLPEEVKPEISKPRVLTDDYLKKSYFMNQTGINGFSALRGAVSQGMEYSLITVNDGYFISEIIADSKDEIAQYDINLKSKIPEGGIKIIGVNEITETKKLKAQIWGYLNSYIRLKEETKISLKEFHKPSEIISRIRAIAKRNGFVIKSYVIQKSFEEDNYKKSPVLLKLQGNDKNSIAFIENLKREYLNFVIRKISVVPSLDKIRVSIAITFEVFEPFA